MKKLSGLIILCLLWPCSIGFGEQGMVELDDRIKISVKNEIHEYGYECGEVTSIKELHTDAQPLSIGYELYKFTCDSGKNVYRYARVYKALHKRCIEPWDTSPPQCNKMKLLEGTPYE